MPGLKKERQIAAQKRFIRKNLHLLISKSQVAQVEVERAGGDRNGKHDTEIRKKQFPFSSRLLDPH